MVPTKFFSPVANVDANAFFSAWKAIPDAPLKLQQICHTQQPLDMNRTRALVGSAGFTVAEGLDPSQSNVVGVGALHCEISGETVVMLRLEVDPRSHKQFRITVASNNALLTSSTKEFLVRELGR